MASSDFRVSLRLFQKGEEVAPITALLHRAYAPLAQAGFRYVASHQPDEHTLRRINRGGCWLAEVDRVIVGTILLMPPLKERGTPWYDRGDVAGLGQFAVDPAFQGHGIGRMLLDKVEQQAREMGVRELALDTAEGARELIALYTRRGYRFIEYADWRPQTNYRSMVMSLTLE